MAMYVRLILSALFLLPPWNEAPAREDVALPTPFVTHEPVTITAAPSNVLLLIIAPFRGASRRSPMTGGPLGKLGPRAKR